LLRGKRSKIFTQIQTLMPTWRWVVHNSLSTKMLKVELSAMSSEECIIQYSVHESLEIILVECTRIFCSQKIIILGFVSDWSPFVCVF
jgi:hypothetical protein